MDDYMQGKKDQRYIYHELPDKLPYPDNCFDIGLSSHFLLGNTAQSWWCRCAVRSFVRLYENDAAGLSPSKEFSCKMTKKLQADV
ncbi:MAG: hypothetical protein IJ060_12590, partial [Oscillospiraceae bacterium]|nr:hypothetical protein [Oscillospiraceae bacterium]